MNKNIRKIKNILQTEFIFFISATIIIIALYETNTMPSGALTCNNTYEFTILTVMELSTLALTPLSLKLMKIKKIRKSVSSNPRNQMYWSMLRISLIGTPMTVNTLLYYSYMNVAFGYMAIIGLLCMSFIYPSMEICKNESMEEK